MTIFQENTFQFLYWPYLIETFNVFLLLISNFLFLTLLVSPPDPIIKSKHKIGFSFRLTALACDSGRNRLRLFRKIVDKIRRQIIPTVVDVIRRRRFPKVDEEIRSKTESTSCNESFPISERRKAKKYIFEKIDWNFN